MKLGFVLPILLLAACATTPRTPAQTVFALEGGYGAALSVAVQYKNLPPCPGPALCSDAAVVARLQAADRLAFADIQAAQAAVTQGLTPTVIEGLVNDALVDLAAFQTQTAALKVK